MTSTELLDALIARLPDLRDQGVTHLSVDPTSGAVSMLIAPKLPEPTEAGEQKNVQQWDPTADGAPAGAARPLSFRERAMALREPVLK